MWNKESQIFSVKNEDKGLYNVRPYYPLYEEIKIEN